MLIIKGNYITAGVDYLTLTEVIPTKEEGIIPRLWGNLSTDSEVKRVSWGGYKGWVQNGIKIGSRERDGKLDNIFVASGENAAWVMEQGVSELTSQLRCTRVDVQATVELDKPDVDLAKNFFEDMKKTPSYKSAMVGRRSIVLYDSEDGQTLYIGKRKSRRMIVRVYDKSEHYNLPLGSAWRFEIEFKRELADSALSMVSGNKNACIGVANDTLSRECGIWLPGSEAAPGGVSSRTDERDTLRWLRTCVKPVVSSRIAGGQLESTLSALGLDWTINKVNSTETSMLADLEKLREQGKDNTE